MSRRTRAFGLITAALVTVAFLAGCSSSSKSSTPTTTDNKGFDISTPDGKASLSLSGNLPPGWPSAFPIPSNAEVAGSGSLGNSSESGMVAVYTISGAASDTYDFYKSNPLLSVTDSSSAGVGSAFVGTVQFAGTYTGSVTLAGRNSKTYLAIVLKSSSGSTTTTGVGETTTTGAGPTTTAAETTTIAVSG